MSISPSVSGLELVSFTTEEVCQFRGVYDIAVVSAKDLTLAIHHVRLSVLFGDYACRCPANLSAKDLAGLLLDTQSLDQT